MLMIVISVGFYGMQLLTSHADTAAYYSCNSGDTLSGSTCTHATTYAITQGTYHPPYCGSGEVQNGSTCTSTYHGCAYQFDTDSTPSDYGSSGAGDALYLHCATFMHKLDANLSGSLYTRCSSYFAWYRGYAGYGSAGYGCYNATAVNCGSDTRQSSSSDICVHTHNVYPAYYSCNNGDTQNGSTCTHTTTYAATYHPATTSSSTSGGTSSGSSTGTSSGSTSTKTTTKSTSTPVTITPTQPPSVPTDFKAKVHSSKVVELSWTAGQAAAGVKAYELERSTDNVAWDTIAMVSDTSYTDTATDFATKYYYRIHETDNSGTNSDYATTDVTTGKFSSTGSTIRSDDRVVTINIPSGAFDRDVSCSITSSQGGLPTVPTKLLLVGPYDILCVADDGSIIGNFKKPLTVTMDLSGVSSGYGAVTAKLFDASSESDPKSTYDAKAHKISFELTSEKSFAIYGKKQGGAATKIFFILLLLAVGGVGAVYLRRYWAGRQAATPDGALLAEPLAMMPAATVASTPMPAPAPNAENLFEQAVSKPNCTHLSMAHQVQPQSTGCAECAAEHKHWKGLRICLTCGHVGCSNDSDEQHAQKHYQQTGHPLIYEYGNPKGDSIGWCYIDQTYI